MNNCQWDELRSHAVAAMRRAYTPYSHYPVGAAAIVDDGRIITGCNVENAAYGATLCAECGLISELINGGGGQLLAFVCVNENADVIVPCGRCRQLLVEHAAAEMTVMMPTGPASVEQMLPGAFGRKDLEEIPAARENLKDE